MGRAELKTSSFPSRTQRFYQSCSEHYPPQSSWQRRAPHIVTGGAVGLCIIGYAYHHFSINQFTKAHDRLHIDFVEHNLVNSRENLQNGRWWTLITSSFMHYNFMHIAFNMATLISFGPNAVRLFGPSGFAVLWIGSAAACGTAQVLWDRLQEQERRKRGKDRMTILGYQLVKDDPTVSTTFAKSIGASGSVLGIITAIGCFQPQMGISMLFIPFYIPAWGAGLIFANFSLYAVVTGIVPWIGHAGHLGGMTFGAAYYYAWLKRRLRFRRF